LWYTKGKLFEAFYTLTMPVKLKNPKDKKQTKQKWSIRLELKEM